jgi:hypothetical protein
MDKPPKRIAEAARSDEHRRHAGVHAEKRIEIFKCRSKMEPLGVLTT